MSKVYVGEGKLISLFKSSTPTALNANISNGSYPCCTNLGDFALYAVGGYVTAYDTSLTKTPISYLNPYRDQVSATHIGNTCAIFAGGGDTSDNSGNVVEAYDTSLTKTTGSVALSGYSKVGSAAAHTPKYAIFAGGVGKTRSSGSVGRLMSVDAFNSSLTRSNPTGLATERSGIAATNIGDYAIFAGGYLDSSHNALTTVDAYSDSLVRTSPDTLTIGINAARATHVGNYALIGTGNNNTKVQIYDTSLTKITSNLNFTAWRSGYSGSHVGNYAVFGGGYTNNSVYLDYMDIYDSSLTKMSVSDAFLSPRNSVAATHVGNYVLFGGGYNNSAGVELRNVINAYYLDPVYGYVAKQII